MLVKYLTKSTTMRYWILVKSTTMRYGILVKYLIKSATMRYCILVKYFVKLTTMRYCFIHSSKAQSRYSFAVFFYIIMRVFGFCWNGIVKTKQISASLETPWGERLLLFLQKCENDNRTKLETKLLERKNHVWEKGSLPLLCWSSPSQGK